MRAALGSRAFERAHDLVDNNEQSDPSLRRPPHHRGSMRNEPERSSAASR
jgi:hypothetical protein